MKYEISYGLTDGRRVVYGMIEEENGKYLASNWGNPHRKAFNTFAGALAAFELVESLTDGYIASFEVKRID